MRCKECGEEVLGRSDKQFCDDNCRNSYNNRKNRVEIPEKLKINNILYKNRRILNGLFTQGIKMCKKERLLEMGFCFGYSTYFRTNKEGRVYLSCYDYHYTCSESGFIYISRAPV